ncbi:MAG: DUF4436 family protein [Pseudanabaena sp. ELA607]|jgi:hypothetical protein
MMNDTKSPDQMPEDQAEKSLRQKRRIRQIIGWSISLILFFSAFAGVLYLYQGDYTQRTADWVFGDEKEPNHLSIAVSLTGVAPEKQDLTARISFDPVGTYDNQKRMAKDVRVHMSLENAKSEIALAKGRYPDSLGGTFELYDGKLNQYPFDVYKSDIYIYAVNPKDEKEEVPLLVSASGNLSGYNVDIDYIPKTEFESSDTYIGLRVRISRSIVVKFFALFIMVVMWLVSLTAFSMAFLVGSKRRDPELPMFTFMTALLFALPAVRNLQPYVPPIGGLTDFLSFFWAEALVAGSLSTVVFCWLFRKRP